MNKPNEDGRTVEQETMVELRKTAWVIQEVDLKIAMMEACIALEAERQAQ